MPQNPTPATAGDTNPTVLTPEREQEIRADLAAIPAPPWRWIGSRHAGGPELVTDHSGRQYLLRAAKPTDHRGDELLDPETDAVIYGDLQFRDQREGETYSTMRSGNELAIGRTDYDPDAIVDVANPVARWIKASAQYATELLAEVARLRAECTTASNNATGACLAQYEEELDNARLRLALKAAKRGRTKERDRINTVVADRDAQIIEWLAKKGREEGMSNRDSRTRGDFAFLLADKLSRGAVRPPLSGEVQRLRAEVTQLKLSAELAEEDYRRVVRGASQIEAGLRARVAELERSPLAWTADLDAKSLDNFLITLGTATEHEPMDDAIDAIHQTLAQWRDLMKAKGLISDEDSHEAKVAEYLSTPYTDDVAPAENATVESAVSIPGSGMWVMPPGPQRDAAIASGAVLMTRTVTPWTEATA